MVECMLCTHKVSVQFRLPPILTLQAGFEPTSKWLTATCSTSELLKKIKFAYL